LGDTPLGELAADSAYRNASCVFQDFQRYQLSLRDNVAISDSARLSASSDAEIQDALAAAGFRANAQQMAQGLDTLISKEFGGTDLSRGEWQRLSIARAYYRSHQLVVLDEPTAAIDPFEEDRIYRDFTKLKKDHTAVIITHRLGAVRLADRVLVLKEGRIVAIGTHDRLLDESQYYRRLWTAQSRYLQ
jgi:ATP-binding cassette subfamily B protein